MFKRKKYDYDLIIIGSGAGGSVGAHHARSLGKRVAIFEKAEVGGECPNWACVPTKAILHSAEVYQAALDAKTFGINNEKVEPDFQKIKKWKDLVVSRTGSAHGKETLEKDGIDLILEKARFVNPNEVEAGGKVYSAANFIIATGSTVSVPPIPGLSETGFITFREAVDYDENPPKSMFILGGGPIGCEFAQIFATFGIKVTIADNLDRLLAKEDTEVSDLVKGLFENKGINVLTNVNVHKVEKKGGKKIVHLQNNGSHSSIEVDEILVATGKRPVLDFEPEKAGIFTEGGRIKVNQYLQTSQKHIYAAGDIVGPYLFTHTGYYQSFIAASNIFSRRKVKPDYQVVPRCVFISPEVASVGATEESAKDAKIKIKKGIIPISILGRANTSNEFDGFVKIITDKNRVIIGGSIIAPHAGEMIHEIALAIKLKVKASVLADMLHAYPTFSEGIKIACATIE